MKNKNSFRFKEGKFILGRPLSYKLYEYWQLCMHAFIDCSSLTSATIGNNMTSIGRQSFEDCSVSPILPTSVRRQIIFRYGASLLRSHIDEQVSSTLA